MRELHFLGDFWGRRLGATCFPRVYWPERTAPGPTAGLTTWIGVGRWSHQMHGDLADAPSVPGEANVVAVADVATEVPPLHRGPYQEKVLKAEGGQIAVYQDYRKLLDRDDIDAVAVPAHAGAHWRAAQLHPRLPGWQGRLRRKAAEPDSSAKAGPWSRPPGSTNACSRSAPSGSMFRNREATELLRNGRLGKLSAVVCDQWASSRPSAEFDIPAQPIPEGMDWDRWCRPTEPVPYNERVYLTYNNPGWHNIWQYSGGNLASFGSHATDVVQWGLGTDDTGPVEVWAENANYNARLTYRYANGVMLYLGFPPELAGTSVAGKKGAAPRKRCLHSAAFSMASGAGCSGHRGRFNADPDRPLAGSRFRAMPCGVYKSDHHFQNWIDCIKSRQQPAADVEIGHRACTVCHLGGIARKLGRKLRWDPEREIFPGDDEANACLDRPRRKPYQLPETV